MLNEKEEWERRFPSIIIYGKKIISTKPSSNSLNYTNQLNNFLKLTIAQCIIEKHLWPQVNLKKKKDNPKLKVK